LRRRTTHAWKEEEEASGLFISIIIKVWGMEVLVEEPHGAWLKVVEGNLYFEPDANIQRVSVCVCGGGWRAVGQLFVGQLFE